jgi:hypothetical protein
MLKFPTPETCKEILMAIFIPGCNKPSFTRIANSAESITSIVGGEWEMIPVDQPPTSLMVIINKNQPENSNAVEVPYTRVITFDGSGLLPIWNPFIVLYVENGKFVDLPAVFGRKLSYWDCEHVWSGQIKDVMAETMTEFFKRIL